MGLALPQSVIERAADVRLLVLDVDGVLTDGTLYFGESGEALKSFNIRDGHGIKMLMESGVAVAIITGRRSKMVEERARNLGIPHLIQGAEDKKTALEALVRETSVPVGACAAIGDDVLDLPVLRRVRFAVTVPDAPAIVLEHAHYVTRIAGGRGAVRELCELILSAQGQLDARLAKYLD
jgi:3-deoxy-D-manno-octulosonate 8-phosphate phosphatase (KDO 8-P phosphatase)